MSQTKITRQLGIVAAMGAVVVVLAFLGWKHLQQSHSRNHDDHGEPTQLELNDGKKWATDEPLRQALERYPRYFDHPGWEGAAGSSPKAP